MRHQHRPGGTGEAIFTTYSAHFEKKLASFNNKKFYGPTKLNMADEQPIRMLNATAPCSCSVLSTLPYCMVWPSRTTYHLDVTNRRNAADKQVYSDNGRPIWSDGQHVTFNLRQDKNNRTRSPALCPHGLHRTRAPERKRNGKRTSHLCRLSRMA